MRVYVAAIVKDEQLDIREWVDHNARIGVERITLYDNHPISGGYDRELSDYILGKYVEVVPWPGDDKFRQRAVYNDFCFTRRWTDDDWCAFIDPDEFIEHSNVADLVAQYAEHAGVALCWQCFGADGRIERPELPVQQAYVRPAPPVREHHNFKSIARLNDVAFWNNVHRFTPKGGKHLVDTQGNQVYNDYFLEVRDVAYIKHYITKSWHDYVRRLERGNITRGIRKIETFFQYNPDMVHLRDELTRDLDPLNFKTTQTDKDIEQLQKFLAQSDAIVRLEMLTDADVSDHAFGQMCVFELINFCSLQLKMLKFKTPENEAAVRQRFHDILDRQIDFMNSIPRSIPGYRETIVETIRQTPFIPEVIR